jgi:hypothetical protein
MTDNGNPASLPEPAAPTPVAAAAASPVAAPAAAPPGMGAAAHLVAGDAGALASALGQLLGAAEAKAKQEIHDHIEAVLDGLDRLEASIKSHVTSSTASLSGLLAGKASHMVTAGVFFLVGAGAIASAAALFLGLKAWLG